MNMEESKDAITVKNLYKTFRLPHEKQNSLKSKVVNFYRQDKGYEKQVALEDISFTVKKGEFFGIVGKNGSGKSTLLKLISGIYLPDKGTIEVAGKLTPFIELGVGFNPELSGRENVYLNGALFGFSRKQMGEMYSQIVEFSGLEKFMDQKLKNYSSGMQVRLAFSLAIRTHSDILVMDEVLAVGDAEFQKKCLDVFRQLKDEGKTIVLVTHDMGNVERFCDRVLVLNEGKVVSLTSSHDASSIYARLNIEATSQNKDSVNATNKKKDKESFTSQHKNRWGEGGVCVKRVFSVNAGRETNTFSTGDDLELHITLTREPGYKTVPIVCGLAFFNDDGVNVTGPNSLKQPLKEGCKEVIFTIPRLSLSPGGYRITIVIFDKDTVKQFDFLDRWYNFNIISDHQVQGIVELKGKWSSK